MIMISLILLGLVMSAVPILLLVGLTTPARHEAEVVDEFAAPPQEVYEVIANVGAYPQWRTGIAKVEVVGKIATPDGDRFAFREFGKKRARTFVIEAEVPPSQGIKGLGRRVHTIADAKSPMTGRWIFGFEPRGNATGLHLIEQVEVKNPLWRGLSRIFHNPERAMNVFMIDLRNRLASRNSN